MRRINRAEIARKWVRFCQSTCSASINRRYASFTSAVAYAFSRRVPVWDRFPASVAEEGDTMAGTTAGLVVMMAVWTAGTATRSDAASTSDSVVVLHVDDHAHLPPAELATAEVETTRIYAAAGVRATWEHGTVDPDARPDDVMHLAVVICGAASPGLDPTVAGRAARGTGRVYIYYSRVAFVAHQHARHVGTVLGMTIAHEVGHLLLPQGSHSVAGIMRADLNLTAILPQEFTPRQSAAIKASLSGDARTAR
jgi:hypothetical protein